MLHLTCPWAFRKLRGLNLSKHLLLIFWIFAGASSGIAGPTHTKTEKPPPELSVFICIADHIKPSQNTSHFSRNSCILQSGPKPAPLTCVPLGTRVSPGPCHTGIPPAFQLFHASNFPTVMTLKAQKWSQKPLNAQVKHFLAGSCLPKSRDVLE